ncbi:MAG: 30S ribosomal protein S6 [bacterium]
MNPYELMFVMDAALPEDERREIVNEVEREIIDLDGEVEKSKHFEERDLAYTINNVTRGDYYIIHYYIDPPVNEDLQERLNIRDDVLRYLIIRQDEENPFKEPGEEEVEDEEEVAEEAADEEIEEEEEAVEA